MCQLQEIVPERELCPPAVLTVDPKFTTEYAEPHALKAFLSQEFFSCFAVPSFIATVIVLSGFPENILKRLLDPLLLEQDEIRKPITTTVPNFNIFVIIITS